MPNNLLQLRLVDCKPTPKFTKDLVELLGAESCQLRSLALVRMGLNFSLSAIAKLLDESEFVQELDLAANNLTSMHFVPLLKSIATNTRLISLNLSWNRLIDEKDERVLADYSLGRRKYLEIIE